MIVITNIFPEFKTAKDIFRHISNKPRFRAPFNSQRVKGSQTLAKSAMQHFYHNSSSLWVEYVSLSYM